MGWRDERRWHGLRHRRLLPRLPTTFRHPGRNLPGEVGVGPGRSRRGPARRRASRSPHPSSARARRHGLDDLVTIRWLCERRIATRSSWWTSRTRLARLQRGASDGRGPEPRRCWGFSRPTESAALARYCASSPELRSRLRCLIPPLLASLPSLRDGADPSRGRCRGAAPRVRYRHREAPPRQVPGDRGIPPTSSRPMTRRTCSSRAPSPHPRSPAPARRDR